MPPKPMPVAEASKSNEPFIGSVKAELGPDFQMFVSREHVVMFRSLEQITNKDGFDASSNFPSLG
jgi:hypothetical protein